MDKEQKNKFLQDIRELLPSEREEMVVDLVFKAKSLIEYDLMINNLSPECFRDMDFKVKYNKSFTALKHVLDLISE